MAEFVLGAENTVPKEMTARDEAFSQEKKGQKDRIGFCWFKVGDDGKLNRKLVRFTMEQVYYIKEHGYVLHTAEIEEIIGEPPKPRAGTVIVHYDTNRKGEPTEPLEYEVRAIYLNGAKIDGLQEHNDDGKTLHNHDFVAKCTSAEYKNIEWYPKNDSLWQLNAELVEVILSQARVVGRKLKIGRKVSGDDVREMLGLEVEASTIGGAKDVDEEEFDDMLDDD